MKPVVIGLLLFSTLYSMKAQTYKVRIITTMGKFDIMLYDETPLHRDNFLKLVDSNFYDSLLFHRVVKGFVIQAGDPDSKNASSGATLGEGDLGYLIPAEFNSKYFHKKFALGQARDNNPEKASSACQFYIVQASIPNKEQYEKAKSRSGIDVPLDHQIEYEKFGGTPQLDMSYTVYGEVINGFQVIDKIAQVAVDKNDRPVKDIRIIKCIRLK